MRVGRVCDILSHSIWVARQISQRKAEKFIPGTRVKSETEAVPDFCPLSL
jgi:hypothetical protein